MQNRFYLAYIHFILIQEIQHPESNINIKNEFFLVTVPKNVFQSVEEKGESIFPHFPKKALN